MVNDTLADELGRFQRAWDSIQSLPPCEFTAEEVAALRRPVPADVAGVVERLQDIATWADKTATDIDLGGPFYSKSNPYWDVNLSAKEAASMLTALASGRGEWLMSDAAIEAAARHMANEEATRCKTLDEALLHKENWPRLKPEAREILKAVRHALTKGSDNA